MHYILVISFPDHYRSIEIRIRLSVILMRLHIYNLLSLPLFQLTGAGTDLTISTEPNILSIATSNIRMQRKVTGSVLYAEV